jgi:outer membrane protein assembly factor BamB
MVTNNQQIGTDTEPLMNFYNNGLQNSSWPMFHHDPQHTGRSPYNPDGNWPTVKWKFWMDGMTLSSPAINTDGDIYIGASDFQDSFFSIKCNGIENWRFTSDDFIISSPSICSDGIIYVGSNDGNLYAIFPNGTQKWRVNIGSGWVKSSPLIDPNGIIYVASMDSNRLCAVYPNGTIKWSFYAEEAILCSPALDDNGIIYVGSYDGYMYAVYPNGTMKWRYYVGGPKGIQSSPTITDDGTIYFGSTSGYLYALYPNGSLKWMYTTGYIDDSSPALDSDGTIYIGSTNGKIFSINSNGTIKWLYQTDAEIFGSPAVDNNGIIYIGSLDGNLYALNPNGSLRWKFTTCGGIQSSPAIDENGIIYIAAYDTSQPDFYSYLYALEVINNNPPTTPTITGTDHGKVRQTYDYTIISTDPEDNNISYYIDWDDGTNTGWMGPHPSGLEQTVNHAWNKKGTYTIHVKAKDNHSAESEWGTLQVTMPTSNYIPFLQFWMRLLERLPHTFPILRYLLGFNQ